MEWTISSSDVLEVKYICGAGTQAGINVRHYRLDDFGGNRSFNSAVMAETFRAQVATAYKGTLTTTCVFHSVHVRVLSTTSDYPTEIVTQAIGAGVVSGATGPLQVASLLQVQTGVGGRKGKGRVYAPFPPVSFFTGTGGMTLGAVSAYTALADALKATVNVEDGEETTYPFRPSLAKTPGVAAGYVTNVVVMQKWATQRRRGAYGKPNVL